jgi:integrase
MILANLSEELKAIITDVFNIDESAKLIPIFDKASVEAIFWKLAALERSVARKFAEELSEFVSSLGRSEDQLLVTAEIKRPAARITERDVQLIANLSLTEQVFLEKLELQDRSPKETIGLLLFSAIRFGGLLNKFNVEQFFHKLSNGELPHVINSTAWYDFKHEVAGNVIWLPDPLTLGLLNKWARSQKTEVMSEAYTAKHGWFRYINELISTKERKKVSWSQSSFLDACCIRVAMEIAPALVDIASGITPTCALKQHSWIRVLTEKSPPISLTHNDHKQNLQASKRLPSTHFRAAFEEEVIKNICALSLGKNIQECIDAIREEHELYASALSENTNLLLEWMVYRVLNDGSWSGPMKISSAIKKMRLLHKNFNEFFKGGDILLISEEDVSELYETIIEASPKNRRVTIASAIRDFHDFLVRQYDTEPNYVPDRFVLADSRKNKALTVDAEIVTPWEYSHVKKYLGKVAASPALKDIARLVLAALIIGYRTGMRRSEIQFLRVKDFYICDEAPEDAEIIVREHSLRTLKSDAAYRRLKIGVLFTPQELQFVIQLVRDRELYDGNTAFVFRSSDCKRPYISGKRLFSPLSKLLKQVTGYPLMRPHHLRHSNGSLNCVGWQMPSCGKYSAVSTLTKWIDFKKVSLERMKIIGVKEGLAPSRKTLHALSMMLGHAEPSTTIRHYIHSSHIVLHDQLCLIQPRLKKKTLAELAGMTTRGLLKGATNQKKAGYALGDDEFKAVAIRDKCLKSLEAQQEKIDIPGWRKNPALNLTWDDFVHSGERMELIDYYFAMQDYFKGYDNIGWLENRYAVFGDKLGKVISKANEIFSLNMEVRKGNGTVQRPRHLEAFTVEIVDKSTGEISSEKIYIKQLPNPPRQVRERITIEQMLVSAQALTKKQKNNLVSALEIFAYNSKRSESSINFKNRQILQEFVSAIRLIDLSTRTENSKTERLRLTITAPSKKALEDDFEQLERYWNKSIEFSRCQLDFRKKDLGNAYVHGLAQIDLLSCEAKTAKKASSKRRIGDAGFRVGLYILYVTQSIWNS